MRRKLLLKVAAAVALAAPVWFAAAQHQHNPAAHGQSAGRPQHSVPADQRVPVAFPPELRQHTLTSMRDHLLALQEIQGALAKDAFDRAAEVAERRLGMSSLPLHGSHEVAKYMPQGMQDIGTAMHRSASRFSVAALDAGATNDVRPALSALAEVTANCVACHAAYRLQ
jgi:HAMP domain-containing protein